MSAKSSYLSHLKCSRCEEIHPADILQSICQKCGSHLLAQYDLIAAKANLDREKLASGGMRQWKWAPLLPVHDPANIVHLGEGETPLLAAERLGQQLGLEQLFVKDDSLNPTGTFKARGLTTAVSKAKELGVEKLIIPTAGNAGAALAAYASRAGMAARVIMPDDSPRINIEETRAYGAEVILVKGLISDAGKLAGEMSAQESLFNVATFREPYRVEGKKIMGYELAVHFDWHLPDVIIYPTGGGTGLIGMWQAFHELLALGWLENKEMPRMVSVQADGCAPVVKAFDARASETVAWENAQTIASGLRVPNSFAGHQIMSTLYDSQGIALAVSDDDIRQAQIELSQSEGIFCAPEGAAPLAALKKLVEMKWVEKEQRVVLFNTGAGMKYI